MLTSRFPWGGNKAHAGAKLCVCLCSRWVRVKLCWSLPCLFILDESHCVGSANQRIIDVLKVHSPKCVCTKRHAHSCSLSLQGVMQNCSSDCRLCDKSTLLNTPSLPNLTPRTPPKLGVCIKYRNVCDRFELYFQILS